MFLLELLIFIVKINTIDTIQLNSENNNKMIDKRY